MAKLELVPKNCIVIKFEKNNIKMLYISHLIYHFFKLILTIKENIIRNNIKKSLDLLKLKFIKILNFL